MRLTLDARAIVFHDAKISGVSIASNTLGTLAALDHMREAGDQLSLLEDVIHRYAGTAFLDIELKVPGLESKVITLLRQKPVERGYVVSSFLPDVLETLAEQDPNLPLGFICDSRHVLQRWRELPALYVIPKYRLVSADLLDACHGAKRKVLVWTVNKPSTMYEMADLHVDGIISDDTKLMVETLRRPVKG